MATSSRSAGDLIFTLGLLGIGGLVVYATSCWIKTNKFYGAFGAAGGPIKSIQIDLQKIGLPVQPTGVLDDPTVTAINGVFEGSVDVPPKLATGKLTKHDIASSLPVVAHALKVIVRGAMVLPSVEEGG